MITENLNDVDIESGNALIDVEETQLSTKREKTENTTKVEDLPLQDRIKLAKNCPNPFGTLKPGVFIDALDSINAWCVASIVEVDENMLKIHFDGWPTKWDEWMRVTSYKIAPFRKHSIGYTGQTKVAIRKIDLTTEDFEALIDKMDGLIKNYLKGLGAIETTQFYRGLIFIYLDHLLGKTYESNESEQLEVAIKFTKKVLELIATYLKILPSLLDKFNEAKREPDLYLVDENVAIALCYQEFTEMLKIIFC